MNILDIRNFLHLEPSEQLIIKDKYLRHQMTKKEREEFENMLEKNPELKAQIEMEVLGKQLPGEYLKSQVSPDTREMVKQKHSSAIEAFNQVEARRIERRRKIIRYSIVTIFGLALLLSPIFVIYTPTEQLVTELNAEIEPLPPFPCKYIRSYAKPQRRTLDSVTIAYANCNYQECIKIYESKTIHTAQECFFAAHSYLILNSLVEAKKAFDKVVLLDNIRPVDLAQAKLYAEILNLQLGGQITGLDLDHAEISSQLKEAIKKRLIAAYIKKEQFNQADSIATTVDNLDWQVKTNIRLQKWKQSF